MLTCLLLMAYFYRTEDYQPREVSSTMGWALPHQSLIKKNVLGLAYSLISYRGIFSIEVASSQMTDSLCDVYTKLTRALSRCDLWP